MIRNSHMHRVHVRFAWIYHKINHQCQCREMYRPSPGFFLALVFGRLYGKRPPVLFLEVSTTSHGPEAIQLPTTTAPNRSPGAKNQIFQFCPLASRLFWSDSSKRPHRSVERVANLKQGAQRLICGYTWLKTTI